MESLNDLSQIKAFCNYLRGITDNFGMMRSVNTLINSPQPVIDQFSETNGMRQISGFLKQAVNEGKDDLIDRIMIFLQRVTLTKEILEESHIGNQIVRLRERNSLPDHIKGKVFKYYIKYRDLIEEWVGDRKKDPKVAKKSKNDRHESDVRKKIRKNSDEISPKRRKKKQVRFLRDEELVKFKIFKREDEPSSKGLTTEEHNQFLRKHSEEIKYRNTFSADEIKHLESQMEGRSHKQQQNAADVIQEQIKYYRPQPLQGEGLEDVKVDSIEKDLIQQRIQSKMLSYYHRETDIPPEPTYVIQNVSNTVKKPKIIKLEIPNNEDLLQVVNMLCQNKEKEIIQEQLNKNKKPMKGILKKPPGEKKKEEEQKKEDIMLKISKLHQMLQNRDKYQSGELFSLINEIILTMKEQGTPQYIQNISIVVQRVISSQEQKQQELNTQQQRLQAQQDFMRQRQMQQHQSIPPHHLPVPQPMNRMQIPGQMGIPGTIIRPPGYPQQPIQQQPSQIPFKAYKTKPCINFHSPKGCLRGDNCNFIHDMRFPGVPVPPNINMRANPNLFNQLIPNLSPQHQPVLNRIPQFPMAPQQTPKYESL